MAIMRKKRGELFLSYFKVANITARKTRRHTFFATYLAVRQWILRQAQPPSKHGARIQKLPLA
ncbi:hypothetical protein M441DRAFT_55415 [Trichoderma asperellum CBS 433.97]|uniref:Uncharacterized protein n=1 Tax=Trichoderma asperellum (strain ATCC 204424 / CBS 433.97 / NBRC 101777) TaxID=1042311 RepID=A0A2T3ZHT6_TRIA4|nr:hypothetical protein M441DRAFT_55415 [Trichoderma asperellum CBS 433.97]PTB44366.1 hypothetical protein M441DRAFT_55415 [Trichoderma asperellum CBS 433.97]